MAVLPGQPVGDGRGEDRERALVRGFLVVRQLRDPLARGVRVEQLQGVAGGRVVVEARLDPLDVVDDDVRLDLVTAMRPRS